MDQELPVATAIVPGRQFLCSYHFSAWNDIMATSLKVWRRVGNLSLSVDVYLLEEQLCQFHPNLLRSEACFAPTARRTTRWVAIWNQYLILKLIVVE